VTNIDPGWQQYPGEQGYGQGYGQPPWRPEQYDPQFHHQRLMGDQYAQPQPGYQPPAGPPWHRPRRKRHWVLWSIGGFAALIVIVIAASSNHNNPGNSSSAAQTSAAAATPSSAPASSDPSPSSSPAGPSMTTAQQQAVDAAQGYLQMGSGFSYESLLNQLTSSSGDGFSTSDAKFAISYLHPDWDAQAVEAAKGYLQVGGFSRASLIQQLESSYGDGFTASQAEYAANKVGL
jgi:hypothetical protein